MGGKADSRLQFYPVDITYRQISGKTNILMFAKTPDARKVCLVERFDQYFYVLAKHDHGLRELAAKIGRLAFDGNRVVQASVEHIFERDVVKVAVESPIRMGKIIETILMWDAVQEVMNTDIPVVRKYLFDRSITPLALYEGSVQRSELRMKVPAFEVKDITGVSDASPDLDVLGFGIKTYYSGDGLRGPEKNPIIMISVYGKSIRKVITWKRYPDAPDYVEYVDSESEIISRFKEIIDNVRPDVLAGFNSARFGLPYIEARAQKYKMKLDLGLDYSEASIDPRNERCRIIGIVHADCLGIMRRLFHEEIRSAGHLAGPEKVSSAGGGPEGQQGKEGLSGISRAWETGEDINRYYANNLSDAGFAYGKFSSLLPKLKEIVGIVGQQLFAVSRMSRATLFDWYALKNYEGLVPPKALGRKISERRQKVAELFMAAARPGLYERPTFADIENAYPYIISEGNIASDSLDCSCCVQAGRDHWFCRRKKGFLPGLADSLIHRFLRVDDMSRLKPDSSILAARKEALELLLSSMFRYMADARCRFFSYAVLEEISMQLESRLLKLCGEQAEVAYRDTSVAILSGNPEGASEEDPLYRGIKALKSALVIGGGKTPRYAYLNADGELVIRGMRYLRRKRLVLRCAEKIIRILLEGKGGSAARAYLKDIRKELESGTIPNEDLIISTRLMKEISMYDVRGPHVVAAKKLAAKGVKVVPGSRVNYIICKGDGSVSERVRLPDEVKQGDYDPGYYFDKHLIPGVEEIFAAAGESIEEPDHLQSKLDGFIWKETDRNL